MHQGIKSACAKLRGLSARRKRAAIAVIGGATVAAVVGLAVPAGAAPLAPHAGTESLQIMSTSVNANTAGAIMYGVFTTVGVDHLGNTTDKVVTAKGSFKIKHPEFGPFAVAPPTCLVNDTEDFGYTIVGGSGKYKGISGHGKASLSVLAIFTKTKTGACNLSKPPKAEQLVINGSGPVSLP
jgi:hypothetical protein